MDKESELFSTPIGEQKRSHAEKQKQKKMAEDLQALIHQRGAVKGKLTRIKNTLLRGQEENKLPAWLPDEYLLRSFLKTIDAAYEEFNSFQNRIYALVPGKAEEQEEKYVEFEELHYEVRANVCRLLDAVKPEPQPVVPAGPVMPVPVPVRAEPVRVQSSPLLHTPLPSFDGKVENWFKFKAIFTDIMSKYPGESDATKLYHLDKCLIGDAAGVIDQQTINDSNFAAAWNFLVERYEDRRKMVDIHVSGLLHLKPMTAESGKQLRSLVDECKRHVEALKFHDYEMSGLSDVLVVNILASKLDLETRKLWEASIEHGEIPTYADTIAFLATRSQVLERIEPTTVAAKQKKPTASPAARIPPVKTSCFAASEDVRCNFCSQGHYTYQCGEYLKLPPNERFEKAKQARVCYNCLRKGHITSRCSSSTSCKVCKKRHHSTLHVNATSSGVVESQTSSEERNPSSTPATTSVAPASKPPSSTVTASCVLQQQQALLCTAIVNVIDRGGQTLPCRVLLDCGSQANLLTEKFATLLQAKREPADVKVVGVDGKTTKVKSTVEVTIQSKHDDYTSSIQCLVMNRITGVVPTNYIDVAAWPIPSGLLLADPEVNRPQRVDMLIGIGHFFSLLRSGKIKLADYLPHLQETVFGWVVGGLVDAASWNYKVFSCSVSRQEPNLEKLVEKFWESEEVYTTSKQSSEEQACEDFYQQTHSRDSSGRYVVKLPFRDNVEELGDSKQHALQRFGHLEKKLNKDRKLKQAYCEFMDEYLRLGHCRVVEDSGDDAGGFYLPHHAILKPTSSTTKLRTVFDASAKSSSGLSLNDTLMIGPTIQDSLLDIVLRFRTHAYVFTGDISKMYRMVGVHPEHTKFQRVFWRADTTEPLLKTLELSTVTYGTASAPYLATRTLKQLALDEGARHPHAANVLVNDFYIDDVLTGAETLEEAAAIREDLVNLLRKGGFELHKWCCNSEELLASIPEELREKQTSFELQGEGNVIKTLGLLWDPTNDQLRFHIAPTDTTQPVTKRFVLSEIAKIFDPLGLLAPVVIVAKLLIRQLWRQKVSWDEVLPTEQVQEWNRFRRGLQAVAELKIERPVLVPHKVRVELHAFSDASLEAFGTCVYLRSVLQDGTVEVRLLVAKSRVASKATIPRLELCAFRLMARVVTHVAAALKMDFNRKVLWADSQIVLCWVKKSPHLLNTYVANRVGEIQELTSSFEYKYVRSESNPADAVSRGLPAAAMLGNQLWWHGPEFLRQHNFEAEQPEEIEDLPEVKVTLARVSRVEMPVLTKFSSFRRLQRVMAFVIRFVNKTRKRRTCGDTSQYPTVQELRSSLNAIVRMVQREELQADIQQISKCQGNQGDERYVGRFRGLNPWIDNDGILRVNGRIKYADVHYEQKCPAILPAQHIVTKLLVEALHKENLHIGPSGLLSILRQRYWVLNGRNVIRQQLGRCVRCFKVKPPETKLYMGDLPPYRVTQAFPFERTGIDFAGPIYIRKGHPRKPFYEKGYMALFVCMVTKCVHIELVSDLSTASFIAALHRFVSYMGVPSDIFSDNATNFAGACSELHELYMLFKQEQTVQAIEEFRMPREIRWHFIPPRSPHVGGIWEAGVKSAKHFLKRTAGETKLTEEEWRTLFAQIEGIMNSRPLIAQSADPGDYDVLTPGHLLIGRPINAIPEPSYDNVKPGLLTRWQHIQKMRTDFWKRWSVDYLAELQQRQKWNKQHTVVKVGDLVLLREENVPPLQWRIGRVIACHPGKDNVTRVVTVKTTAGEYKRSTAKIAVLPLDDPEPKQTKESD